MAANLDFEALGPDWHLHVDYYGYGCLSWRHRREHLQIAFHVLHGLADRLLTYGGRFQVYVELHERDAALDTLYFLSEDAVEHKNPENYFVFPIKMPLPLVAWGVPEVEAALGKWCAPYPLRAGTHDAPPPMGRVLYVYSPGLAVPIEPAAGDLGDLNLGDLGTGDLGTQNGTPHRHT